MVPSQVRDVGTLTPTSSGSVTTNALGHLDDASAITIFTASSANSPSSQYVLQVSVIDPADAFPLGGVTATSGFFDFQPSITSTGLVLLGSAASVTIGNLGFRGLRMRGLTSAFAADTIAYVTKQISV